MTQALRPRTAKVLATVEEKEKIYTLEMTQDEANKLVNIITNCIPDDVHHSRQGIPESVLRGLYAKIQHLAALLMVDMGDIHGDPFRD